MLFFFKETDDLVAATYKKAAGVCVCVYLCVCVCVFIKLHITAQPGCRTIPSMLLVWILPMGDQQCVCAFFIFKKNTHLA